MAVKSLNAEEVSKYQNAETVVIIDSRAKKTFSNGFIPGSVFIGLENENFEQWAKMVVPADKNIILISEPGTENTAAEKLIAAGFSVLGFLVDGFESWQKENFPIDMIIDVETDEFAMDIPFDSKMVILDVRTEEEFEKSHVKNAVNVPLNELSDTAVIANFDEEDNHYIYCGGGYRSLVAASLFKKEGLHNLRNILGGFSAIKNEKKIQLEESKKAEKK